MTYTLTRYQLTTDPDNRFPLTITDVTADASAASITFIGKKYPAYGSIINDNFLWLTENFAGTGSPSNPITGQLWYDTGDASLKVYDQTWNSVVSNSNAVLKTGSNITGTISS